MHYMNKISKIIVAAVVLAFSAGAAQARVDSLVVNNRFFDNTFIMTGAGLQGSFSPGMGLGFNSKGSFVMDVSAGKWFTPSLGFRLGFQGLNFNDIEEGSLILPGAIAEPVGEGNKYNVRTEYSYLHADLLWNMTNAIGGYKRDRRISVIPYLHIGYNWLYNTFKSPVYHLKSDYSGGAGVIASLRIYDCLSVFGDIRFRTSVRNTLDSYYGKKLMELSMFGLVGLSYDFSRSDWDRSGGNKYRGYVLNEFMDNTFVGFSLGRTRHYVLNEDIKSNAKVEFLFGFNAGKWFTPDVGARIGYDRSKMSHYAFSELDIYHNLSVTPATLGDTECNLYSFYLNNIHGDLLWNVFNTFAPYRRDRLFQLVPYASFALGLSESIPNKKIFRNDFLVGLGLSANLCITPQFSLNVDYRGYHMAGREYGHTLRNHSIITDLSLGATYNIRNKPWGSVDPSRVVVRKKPEDPKTGPMIKESFFDNTFFSLSAGANCTFNQGIYAAPAMELTFGKWFSPAFGLRAGLAGMNRADSENEIGIFYPHADVLVNVLHWQNLYSPEQNFNFALSPYVGLGYFCGYTSDTESPRNIFSEGAFNGGVLATYRIGKRGFGSIDLRYTKSRNEYVASGMLGLGYYIGEPEWVKGHSHLEIDPRERGENLERVKGFITNTKLFDNTFISYSAGVNSFDFDGGAMALDLSAGKWWTPSIGIRAGYQGRKVARNSGTLYTKLNTNIFHFDLMWNPVATCVGYNPKRIFDPAVYFQTGIMNFRTPIGARLGYQMFLGGGLMGSFHVSDRLDLFMDLKGIAVKDPYTRSMDQSNTLFASALAGVSYDFGANAWAPAQGDAPVPDRSDDRARYLAISTNILGYADLLTLNLEFQYAVDRHWTLAMQGKSNNLILKNNGSDQIMDRKSVASLGTKYWPWYVYCGLWAEGFLQVEGYSRAHLSKNMAYEHGDAYGGGVALGYSIMLNRWFNIDIGAGVWAGYDKPKVGDGKAFVGLSDISVSAMFVF